MLVLSRKMGERIVIGDNIEVEVVAIGKGRVKLGFAAPISVPIHRSELTPLCPEKDLGKQRDSGCGHENVIQAP